MDGTEKLGQTSFSGVLQHLRTNELDFRQLHESGNLKVTHAVRTGCHHQWYVGAYTLRLPSLSGECSGMSSSCYLNANTINIIRSLFHRKQLLIQGLTGGCAQAFFKSLATSGFGGTGGLGLKSFCE